jgi:hypothetical protein
MLFEIDHHSLARCERNYSATITWIPTDALWHRYVETHRDHAEDSIWKVLSHVLFLRRHPSITVSNWGRSLRISVVQEYVEQYKRWYWSWPYFLEIFVHMIVVFYRNNLQIRAIDEKTQWTFSYQSIFHVVRASKPRAAEMSAWCLYRLNDVSSKGIDCYQSDIESGTDSAVIVFINRTVANSSVMFRLYLCLFTAWCLCSFLIFAVPM